MRCSDCMKVISEGELICPHCGHQNKVSNSEVYHLAPGVLLHNRYEIVSVEGFGGFGVVYKAWDTNLERVVAVKEYFPTMYLSRDAGCVEAVVFDKKNEEIFLKEKDAFLSEARNMASFSEHPNIVHVYDYFEDNNTAYFVMEYMDGKSLNEYINEAREQNKVLTVNSAVHITLEVLKALKDTHAKGIIHRDIKPHNIYVLKNGAVKIFDFGAARFSNADKVDTRTVIITPGYAPPEQYQIKSKQGPYTDVYSLGAVLYEMVTGVKPEESINRKVEDSVKNPQEYNSKIPDYLGSVIMRAIAIRPEIRFQNVTEFENALKKEKKVKNPEREIKRRKKKRNRLVFLSIIIALGALLYTGYGIYRDYRKAVLATGTLSVWVPEINSDSAYTLSLYDSITEEFRANNPQVTVEYTIIPADTYVETLKNALENGTGPDVFDSTELGGEYVKYLADVDYVYEDQYFDASQYYLYDRYKQEFERDGKVPLLFDVPVLYVNSDMEGLEAGKDYQSFFYQESNYIGMATEYEQVLNDMAGRFEISEEILPEENGVFLNCLSINNASTWLEKEACGRLIHYFLSATSQQELSIEYGLGLPVDKEVWAEYVEINNEFSYLTNNIDSVVFK